MSFKKDYINFVLHTVTKHLQKNSSHYQQSICEILNKTIRTEDLSGITFLVGKTAGLEILFKYILYISDKIDKSQISISNLKDNFDYDVRNLIRIADNINSFITNRPQQSISTPIQEVYENPEELIETIKIEAAENEILPENSESVIFETDIQHEEPIHDVELTLIENRETVAETKDPYDLSEITKVAGIQDESPAEEITTDFGEVEDKIEQELADQNITGSISKKEDVSFDELVKEFEEIESSRKLLKEKEAVDEETSISRQVSKNQTEIEEGTEQTAEIPSETVTNEIQHLPEIEFEIRQRANLTTERSETVTDEVYDKFETRFLEDVKILEILFEYIRKVHKEGMRDKHSEKTLQTLTQISEITTELNNLSRQLSFDFTADIFLVINLFYTKAISSPNIITSDKLSLMNAALQLANSLVKGEESVDNEDNRRLADEIVFIKGELEQYQEQPSSVLSEEDEVTCEKNEQSQEAVQEEKVMSVKNSAEEKTEPDYEPVTEKKKPLPSEAEFRMNYYVEELERNFRHLNELKGQYGKFDAFEEIDMLNNSLRRLALTSAEIRQNEISKLAEVTYNFLKFLQDFSIDPLDPEIEQILKYVIFNFKMLLKGKKTRDYDLLVEHLNNPIKIFSDS
jgi:hypothetical protein